MTIAPRRRLTINPGQLAAVSNSSFATIVESDHEVVVERTMKWDQSNYGAHTEKAIAGPASNWFFAEGSQGFFLTYVLLTNPSALAEPGPRPLPARDRRAGRAGVHAGAAVAPHHRLRRDRRARQHGRSASR